MLSLFVSSCFCAAAGAPGTVSDAMVARSVVNAGDTARLQRVFAKARRGEAITVAVIGGSITQGASATTAPNRYGNRVAAWWRENFPGATVNYVNAGIGATGSDYGALRAPTHLLKHRPDFVVMEYSVNDGANPAAMMTLEGLVRQVLKQPNDPAVMLLFMMHQGGRNTQEFHAKVGAHYALPMVSFRDALWPEVQAGSMKWEDSMADTVHPNDAGHEQAARLVTAALAKVLRDLPADDRLPAVAPLPAPLVSDQYEYTALMEAPDLKPTRNEGWTLTEARGGKCWRADKPGSVIEFQVPGTLVNVMFWRVREGMGRARVQVDDAPPVLLEAWFDQTWGGYRVTTTAARDLAPGTHRVRIELLEEKHASSDGHDFRLLGLGTAGVR